MKHQAVHTSVAVFDDLSHDVRRECVGGVIQYGLHRHILEVSPMETVVIVDAVRGGGLRWKYRSVLAQRHAEAA